MSDQNPTPTTPTEAPAATAKKSGLLKYILLGGILMVLVVGVVAATIMVMGKRPTTVEADSTAIAAAADSTTHTGTPKEPTEEEILDSLMALESGDTSVLALIQENLEVLDYNADSMILEGEAGGMSAADSLEAVTWLTEEKKRLNELEVSLTTRETEVAKRENEVGRKMLVIEQAESARVMELARLYDNMDARAVAKLMTNLDDETVVSILPRMKAKNASQVLQLLPAPRAAKLSKQMITVAEADE